MVAPLVAGFSIFAAVLALVGVGWPALLVGLAVLTLMFPARFGLIRRVALAGLAYLGYGLLTGTVFSVLGWQLAGTWYCAVFVLLAGAIAVWMTRQRSTTMGLRCSGDLAITMAVVILGVLFLSRGLGQDAAGLVSNLSQGGDNANHLNLIRAIQRGQGFQYPGPLAVPGLLPGMEAYPQGFAFLVGYTGWMFTGLGAAPSVAVSVWTSWVMFALQPVAAVAISLLVVRAQVLRHLTSRRHSRTVKLNFPMAVAAIVIAGILLMTLYVHLWTFGFQTQMFAMNAVLTAVWLATDPVFGRRPADRLWVLVGVSVCVVAIALSWYLLAPPAIAVALLVGWPLIRNWRSALRRRAKPQLWLLVLVSGAAALYPVAQGTSDSVGHLVMYGGIRIFSPITGAALAVLVALFWLAGQRRWTWDPTAVAGIAAVLLAFAVGLFQLVQAGEFSYYFFKVLYLPAALAVIPIGSAVVRYLLDRRWSPVDHLVTAGIGGVAALSLAVLALTEIPTLTKPVVGQVHPGVIGQVLRDYPDGIPVGADVVATGFCNWRLSGQTTSWVGGLFTSWNPDRERFYRTLDSRVEAAADLITYAEAAPTVTISAYVDPGCVTYPGYAAIAATNLQVRPFP